MALDRHKKPLGFENDLQPVKNLVWGSKEAEVNAYFSELANNRLREAKKYDEGEARDESGKWTSGAATHEQLRDMAWKHADDLGFPRSRVAVVDEEYPFTVNGVAMKAAGSADTQSPQGMIKIYKNQITPETMPGVMAHEVSHMKFADAQRQYKTEEAAIFAEPVAPGKDVWDSVIKPSGELREPYAEKYPHYQAMHDSLYGKDMTLLSQSDGVSDYSKHYWEAWHKGEVSTDSAVHETLAEMHRLKLGTGKFPEHQFSGPLPRQHKSKDHPEGFATTRGIPQRLAEGAKAWRKLYKAVHK